MENVTTILALSILVGFGFGIGIACALSLAERLRNKRMAWKKSRLSK